MKKILFLYFILSIGILISLKKNEGYLLQDEIYKYQQLQEFKLQSYNTFTRYYPSLSKKIDPAKKFRIHKEPFEYKIGNISFSVFPYAWTLINSMFFLLFSFYGIYIIPIIGGALSIISLRLLLRTLEFDPKTTTTTLYFYIFSTPLLIYSTWYYEASLCNAILFFSVHLALEKNTKDIKRYFLAGALAGLLLFLRIEIAGLAFLITLLLVLNINYKKEFSLYFIGFFSIAITMLSCNYFIYDSIHSPRTLDSVNFSVLDRFIRITEYLFTTRYSMIVYMPYSLAIIPSFFYYKKNSTKKKSVLSALIIFILIVPFIAPNSQGHDTTPRYYFPITALLFGFCLDIISKKNFKYKQFITSSMILYSSIFILLFFTLIKDAKRTIPYSINFIKNEQENINIYYYTSEIQIGELLRIHDFSKSYFLVTNEKEYNELLRNISQQDTTDKSIKVFYISNNPSPKRPEKIIKKSKVFYRQQISIFKPLLQ